MRRARTALVAVWLGLGACDNDALEGPQHDPDPDELPLRMFGSCTTGGESTLVLSRRARQGNISVMTSSNLDVPASGAFVRSRRPLRDGGWQLFGDVCLPNGRLCPDSRDGSKFRRCVARRVDWFLQLTCTDGFGNPTCDAQLME